MIGMTGGKMTAIGYHSTTSMAVKAVVAEVKKQLVKKFDFLPSMPDFFYDFDKGLTDQFKQYYAKVPERDRQNDWIVLSYSYDSASRSSVHGRTGLSYCRPVSQGVKRRIDVQYVELPLLFSVLTNDSKCLNGLSNYINIKFNQSFSVDYPDLLWPTWRPNQFYPVGWYVRPSVPDGSLYMCTVSGVSGEDEPVWSVKTEDNQALWTKHAADMLRVKAGSFVKNDTTIQNPIENGIMYQYDFGFTLHYTDYEDTGDLVGVISKVVLELLDYYNQGLFSETIVAQET